MIGRFSLLSGTMPRNAGFSVSGHLLDKTFHRHNSEISNSETTNLIDKTFHRQDIFWTRNFADTTFKRKVISET